MIGVIVALLSLGGAAILAYRRDEEPDSSDIIVVVGVEYDEVEQVFDFEDEDMKIRGCASERYLFEALQATRQNEGRLIIRVPTVFEVPEFAMWRGADVVIVGGDGGIR